MSDDLNIPVEGLDAPSGNVARLEATLERFAIAITNIEAQLAQNSSRIDQVMHTMDARHEQVQTLKALMEADKISDSSSISRRTHKIPEDIQAQINILAVCHNSNEWSVSRFVASALCDAFNKLPESKVLEMPRSLPYRVQRLQEAADDLSFKDMIRQIVINHGPGEVHPQFNTPSHPPARVESIVDIKPQALRDTRDDRFSRTSKGVAERAQIEDFEEKEDKNVGRDPAKMSKDRYNTGKRYSKRYPFKHDDGTFPAPPLITFKKISEALARDEKISPLFSENPETADFEKMDILLECGITKVLQDATPDSWSAALTQLQESYTARQTEWKMVWNNFSQNGGENLSKFLERCKTKYEQYYIPINTLEATRDILSKIQLESLRADLLRDTDDATKQPRMKSFEGLKHAVAHWCAIHPTAVSHFYNNRTEHAARAERTRSQRGLEQFGFSRTGRTDSQQEFGQGRGRGRGRGSGRGVARPDGQRYVPDPRTGKPILKKDSDSENKKNKIYALITELAESSTIPEEDTPDQGPHTPDSGSEDDLGDFTTGAIYAEPYTDSDLDDEQDCDTCNAVSVLQNTASEDTPGKTAEALADQLPAQPADPEPAQATTPKTRRITPEAAPDMGDPTPGQPKIPEPLSSSEFITLARGKTRVPMSRHMKDVEAVKSRNKKLTEPTLVHNGLTAGQTMSRQTVNLSLGQLYRLMAEAVRNPDMAKGLNNLLNTHAIKQGHAVFKPSQKDQSDIKHSVERANSVEMVGMPNHTVRFGTSGSKGSQYQMYGDIGAPAGLIHDSIVEANKERFADAVWYDIDLNLSGFAGDSVNVTGFLGNVPVRMDKNQVVRCNFVVVSGKVTCPLIFGGSDFRRYQANIKYFKRTSADGYDGYTILYDVPGAKNPVKVPWTVRIRQRQLSNGLAWKRREKHAAYSDSAHTTVPRILTRPRNDK